MCRLYGFHSTEPTKVECTLVHAQNALLTQSAGDQSGYSHTEGWGIAMYENAHPVVEKQAWAAYHGEHFERSAAKVYAHAVLAHIRRATVGTPSLENTHPFHSGRWSFAHNGTIPNIENVRSVLLEHINPVFAARIKGETDSELAFALFLTRFAKLALNNVELAVRDTVSIIETAVKRHAPGRKLGLNMMLTDGKVFCGTRYGRTLYKVEREGVYDCEICGFPHIHHNPDKAYRAVVIASEPITSEDWQVVPDHSFWMVGPDSRLEISKL